MSKVKKNDVVFYEGQVWEVTEKAGEKGTLSRYAICEIVGVSLEYLKPLTCKDCKYFPYEEGHQECKHQKRYISVYQNHPACIEFDCLQCKDCFIYDWVEDCCMKYGTKNCELDFPCNDFSGPRYAIEETESLH